MSRLLDYATAAPRFLTVYHVSPTFPAAAAVVGFADASSVAVLRRNIPSVHGSFAATSLATTAR